MFISSLNVFQVPHKALLLTETVVEEVFQKLLAGDAT